MSRYEDELKSREPCCMIEKGRIKGSDIFDTALKIQLRQTKVSGITNRDETLFRWHI